MKKYFRQKTYNILRWAEKWTKTDMVYLAKGTSWMAAGQLTSILSAFLLALAFANFLPVETYGKYKYILSLITILSIPTLTGMNTAIIQAVAKGNEGMLFDAIKIKMKWGVFGSAASIILSLYYYTNNNLQFTFCFLIIAIFIPLLPSLQSYGAFLNGKKLFKNATIYNICFQAVITITTFIVLYFTNNLLIIIFSYFASNVFFNAIALYYVTIKHRPNKKKSPEGLHFGKHLSLMGVISTIAENIDKILIWHFLGPIQLSIYAFATIPIDQMKSLVLKNIANLALPKFSENTIQNIKKTLPGKIIKLSLITTFISIIYIFLSPYIYKTFFPQYTESIYYTRLLVFTLAILPVSLLNTVLTSQGYKKRLYFLSVTSNIIKIILFIVLLPLFNITGMVFAILGTQAYDAILLIYFFKKTDSFLD